MRTTSTLIQTPCFDSYIIKILCTKRPICHYYTDAHDAFHIRHIEPNKHTHTLRTNAHTLMKEGTHSRFLDQYSTLSGSMEDEVGVNSGHKRALAQDTSRCQNNTGGDVDGGVTGKKKIQPEER